MGFAPSGPRVLSAVPEQPGLAQFASGLESILTKAKEQRDFTQGADRFDQIIKDVTDKEGNVDFEKAGLNLAADRNIAPSAKAPLQQNLSNLQTAQLNKQKLQIERAKADKEFREQVTAQAESREFGDLIEQQAAGNITNAQAASKAATFSNKDIRSAALTQFGRDTDREARREEGVARVRTEADIKEIAAIRKQVDDDAVAGRETQAAVVLGRAGAEAGTGPFSRAHFSDTFTNSDSKLLQALAPIMQTSAGQAVKTSQLNQVRGSLRSTFGSRPLGTEFNFLIQKLAKAGNTKEVNLLSLDLEDIRAETMIMKQRLFNELRAEAQRDGLDEKTFIENYRRDVDALEQHQLNKFTERLKSL